MGRMRSAAATAVRWRIARWWAPLVAGVGLTLLLLSVTARLTVLDAGYDQRAVARSNAYERLYSQVLPSPGAQQVIGAALRPLPLSASFIAANTRLLLPPAVLDQVVDTALAQFVDYLLGGRDGIDAAKVLQPVVDHTEQLAGHLLPGLVTNAPQVTVSSLRRFDAHFTHFVDALQRGRFPATIPVLPLSHSAAQHVAETLTAGLDPDRRAAVEGQVRLLLASGRLSDAVALVAPAYLAEHPGVPDELTATLTAAIATVENPLRELSGHETVRTLRTLHDVLPVGLWSLRLLGLLLTAAMLALAYVAARRARRSLPAALAGQLAAATTIAAGLGLLVLATLPDPLRTLATDQDLPSSLRAIVADIDDGLRGGVVDSYLHLCGIVALGVVALVGLHLLTRPTVSRRLVAQAGLVTLAGAGAGALVATALPSSSPPATCNGYAALCAKSYDAVTSLAAHNAMAASDAGFINANQDPTMTGQLDNGVRTLLIDLHYWTTPKQVAHYLARLPRRSRAALAPLLSRIDDRPGTWLCHVACQLGASPAIDTLRGIGDWLHDHPDAVVTLIIEDHTSAADTLHTLEAAGLRRYAWSQPAPGSPWPTLGEMVRTGHRLVLFTERRSEPVSWVVDYHDIGAETKFRATSPDRLTCAPGRGPEFARLFLLNNWISSPEPSRADAARVNNTKALSSRVTRCRRERQMRPNFIAVDFAEIGNPLRVVDRLNGVSPAN